jgi:RNA polymerase sigma factor (sigma-70 family)
MAVDVDYEEWFERAAKISRKTKGWTPQHAEDLHSAALEALVKAAKTFDPGGGLPWSKYAFFKIRFAVIDEVRRLRGRLWRNGERFFSDPLLKRPPVNLISIESLPEDSKYYASATDDFERVDMLDNVYRFFAFVPERYLPLAEALFMDGRTLMDIAEETGVTESTIWVRKSRMLREMRQAMEEAVV